MDEDQEEEVKVEWSFWGPHDLREVCAFDIPDEKWESLMCTRLKGHDGIHISLMCDAAEADGVRFCCRVPLEADHRPDCFKLKVHFDDAEDAK